MQDELSPAERAQNLPEIIQGGMGVAVSNWRMAGEVAGTGEMGVVSGTAIGIVLARRLQNGDESMFRVLQTFPDQQIAQTIIDDYYLPGGRQPNKSYKNVSLRDEKSVQKALDLNMVGAYAEVMLAKQLASEISANPGPVGINLLTKLQMPTVSALYGAMLAKADCVIMGAGIPRDIPGILNDLAEGKPTSNLLDVTGSNIKHETLFDPADYPLLVESPKNTPAFLAIISANVLAQVLTREDEIPSPNGFVIEDYTAGGHSAPARNKKLAKNGQPDYGEKDKVDLHKIAALGLPFWLAGSYGTPEGLIEAKKLGANGIQAGSAFALCEASGFVPTLRDNIIKQIKSGKLEIYTSIEASPTGFPFKLAFTKNAKPQNLVNRFCDIGGLREAYVLENSDEILYRCPAENVEIYKHKGGDTAQAIGKLCLCNGLLATVGLGQIRSGKAEEAIITLGDKAPETIKRLVGKYGLHFTATDVVEFLRG
jgi:NAD(P)H-dependent flavin oxidoreductase YrpB (nitropropane dioxygenase family)